MALFSSSKSSTSNQTTYNTTDNSANAGNNAVAIGAGANVQVLSDDVALGSIYAQRDTAQSAIDANAALSMGAINTVAGLAEVSARERQDVLNTTTTALNSQQGLASKIADLTNAALERTQTPDSAVTKQLLWVVGAVAVVGILALFGNAKRRPTS
jgi:uncharacterized protein with beta-barrel porin domain